MKLSVSRKSFSRMEDGELKTYHVGDEFDGSEALLKAFGDRLQKADGKSDDEPAEKRTRQTKATKAE